MSTEIDWSFKDQSAKDLLWMIVSVGLYAMELCVLIALFSKARKNNDERCCSGCNSILSLLLLFSIVINIFSVVFMASNDGAVPTDFTNFAFQMEDVYTTNEKIYFVCYMFAFCTFNVYCLIILMAGTIRGMDSIKPLKLGSITKSFCFLLIFMDLSYRIVCIVSYCTQLIAEKAIFISLYSASIATYLVFLVLILMFWVNAKVQNIPNLRDDYLFDNGVGHLRLQMFVLIIWFTTHLVTSLIDIFLSNSSSIHNVSLWIKSIMSILLNIVVLYYLIPSKGKANISDNIYDTKKRFRAESLSKSLPSALRRDKSNKWPGGDAYCNIHSSLSENVSEHSSYNKGGFIHNKKVAQHSWFDKKENVYGTPESSLREGGDKETTPAYMRQGVCDIQKRINEASNQFANVNVHAQHFTPTTDLL